MPSDRGQWTVAKGFRPMSCSKEPLVSVVVVAHTRARRLDACLETLLEQTEQRLEVVVVLLRPSDAVREVAGEFAARDQRFRPVECDDATPSLARNLGIKKARGGLLYFVDDDVELPPHVVAELVSVFAERPDAAVVGGPNLTPPDDPPFAHLTGAILASRWGTGIARSRYVPAAARPALERHLILCNLVVRRDVFEAGFRFPLLFGGEENVLLGQAEAHGFRMWYAPSVWVYHRRRTTFFGYVRQVYRYGRGRAIAILRAPRTFHVAYFVPVGWLLYLVSLPGLAMLSPLAWWPLAAYTLGVSVASASIAWEHKRPTWLPALMFLFPVTHGAYAAGLLLTLPRAARRDRREGTSRRPVSTVKHGG